MLARIKGKIQRMRTEEAANNALEQLKQQLQDQHLSPAQTAVLLDLILEKTVAPNHLSMFWGDRLLTLDKSAGFLSDPPFRAAYDAVRGSHQYDQYSSPKTISWRLHTLVWAAKCGLNVEGDFVECGVFKGDMSWVISQTVDFAAKQKPFYLYDTYDGFSDKYSSNADFPEAPGFIDYANQFYRDPTLYGYVCNRFKDRSDIKVIKGVVPDVLLEQSPEKIAFLHIDLNSPAAEIGALEILFQRMSSGAILIFDDYGWKAFHRQKEAEDKFMRELGYEILELPTGQGMVVKR
jgi:O-methyltransferase